MKDNNFNLHIFIRLLISLMPLLLGWPMIAFCFCGYNLVMITVTRGGLFGGIATVACALAGALLCLVSGYGVAYGGFFAVQLALASVLCSLTSAMRLGFSTGLLAASASYGIGELMSYKTLADKAGLSIVDYVFSGVEPVFDAAKQSIAQLTDPTAKLYSSYALKMLDAIGDFIKSCIPSAIIISAVAAGYVLMLLVSKSLRGTPLDNGHYFAKIRVGIPAVCFGAVMLGIIFVPNSVVSYVGRNGLMLFLFLSFAAGMSLTDFLLRLKVRGTLPRLGIHFLLLVGGTLLMNLFPLANIFFVYIIMGIVDCFASIRKKVATRQ